jgi:DNA-binding transcriptional ArsR family regulator
MLISDSIAPLEIKKYIDYYLYVMKSHLCSSCFANLAVDSRLKIFQFLKDCGAHPVSDIVAQTCLSQPTISYHLKNMKTAGLLSCKRVGKKIYYSVNQTCPNSERKCVLKQMNFTSEVIKG